MAAVPRSELFRDMDDETALFIFRLQLEDSRQLAADSHSNGQVNNGEETDAEIALRLATEELERNAVLLQGRRIAAAVDRGVGVDLARLDARRAARVVEEAVRAESIVVQQASKYFRGFGRLS
jgi:hypothetical protein